MLCGASACATRPRRSTDRLPCCSAIKTLPVPRLLAAGCGAGPGLRAGARRSMAPQSFTARLNLKNAWYGSRLLGASVVVTGERTATAARRCAEADLATIWLHSHYDSKGSQGGSRGTPG